MKKPACVTVQVASVGLTVKVSVLCMSGIIIVTDCSVCDVYIVARVNL